jgi:DNA invertase Pin-like site-specific DNA recombinase/uncharacterized small protein (DUF1192 family)
MNVVAYCRVSTNDKDQLNSLKTQQEFFEAFAKKNGLNLIRIYSDEGISGTKMKNRKALNRLMHDAQSGIFQAVLFKDVSRLARNTLDFLQCFHTLKALGIKPRFLNNGGNGMEENNSDLIITVLAAIAQEESYNTSKRIKFSKHYNAGRGKVPNFVFGYDKTIGEIFSLNINEGEAETVRNIFSWYTENGDGTLKISARLNEMGIRTKKGCAWSPNAVLRILTNSIYAGKIANCKQEIVNFPDSRRENKPKNQWIVVENEALRIIPDDTFEKAQALLRERAESSNTGKRHSNKHLFSTLIRCGECGHSFRRLVTHYKNTYVRWVCSGRNGRGAHTCENTIVLDEDELISEFQSYFLQILDNKEEYAEKAKEKFRQSYTAEENDEEAKEETKKKLAETKKQKERLIELFTREHISIDEFEEKMAPLKAEISRLEYELTKLSYDAPSDAQFEKALEKTFRRIERITDIRSMTNAQLKEIIEIIEVGKDGVVDIRLRAFEER